MLKDIQHKKMVGFGVAMVPHEMDDKVIPVFWDCYLINMKNETIRDLLITSKGYGFIRGEERRSSTLRYFYPRLEGQMAVRLETLGEELFRLTNEFWVSFSCGGYMFDKRFLFVEGSLDTAHLTPVPVVGKRGVLIQ